MIFLDQERIVETDAVILAAAAKHSILLSGAQAGEGLAGVEDGDAATGYRVRIAAGGGGGAHEGLQEVQGSAFAGENLAGIAAEGAEGSVWGEPITVGHMPFQFHVAQLPEYLFCPSAATHDRLFAGDDGGGAGVVRVDQLGGDIPVADVFFQRKGHVPGDVITDVVGQGLAHGCDLSDFATVISKWPARWCNAAH